MVFRTKLNADGTLHKLKARLVAKEFDQEEGIDYIETYSHVVISATVRFVLRVATVMVLSYMEISLRLFI